jgi:isocitrate dehydrogenase
MPPVPRSPWSTDKGITNLHVPSDVIVDASMPAMIRTSGQMWNAAGKEQDTLAVIPDSSYAGIYQATIDFCKKHGAFDPKTMGTVPNVGLMAQAAEEYGSHNKTFEIPGEGTVRVVDAAGKVLSNTPSTRATSGAPARPRMPPCSDWVKLAVNRARATNTPPSSGSTKNAPTTPSSSPRSVTYLASTTPTDSTSRSSAPAEACEATLERLKPGRTPSPSPATSSAITSPTSSPSSRSAPAPRCSPSSPS